MIPTFWAAGPAPGNLGDVLAPVILRALGVPVRWAGPDSAKLIATGSIIRHAGPDMMVWGSGAMWPTDSPSPRARYLAVRGPLTRRVVQRAGGECPEVYGDPALLLPEIHNTPVEPIHDIGVVPHYVDRPTREAAIALGLPVIETLARNPLAVVDRIRQCRAILSSSLHGIVVAHAYGIPAAWIHCAEMRGKRRKMDGDGTKFRDHAASVGIEMVEHRTLGGAVPVLPAHIDRAALLGALDEVACAHR